LWTKEQEGQLIALWNEGLNYAQIAIKLESTPKSIDHKLRGLRARGKIQDRRPLEKLFDKKSALALEKENAKLKKYLSISEELKKVVPFKLGKELISSKSESVAVLQLSDWHAEEGVNPLTINDLNSYNLEIFDKRATHTSRRALKLIEMNQKDTHIKKFIVHLGGDFISGNIHEEFLESCLLRPTEALLLVSKHLISTIEFFLNNSNLDLLLVCNMGNHPRITKKVRNATEAGNSLEYIMYRMIEEKFLKDKRVQFIIPEGYFAYVDIYGKMFRFSHGHHIKYRGGVGGVDIPLRKAINEWNKAKRADMDLVCHFHTTRYAYRYILNGSMIGYNAYALNNKMEYEPPAQNFFLTHKTKGTTIVSPIYY